jgi:hypothetical protein
MSQISYEKPQYSSKNREKKESFLIHLVLRTGLAKDKKQANLVLLAMSGVFFLATLGVLFMNGTFNSSGGSNEDINYEEYGEYGGSEYTEEEYMME